MTQDMVSGTTLNSPVIPPKVPPPLVNSHFLLPLRDAKYAPRTLRFKQRKHELANFMKVYEHFCAHFDITDSAEKCKDLITYCLSKVAEMIEKFPSYNKGDYRQLISDLAYFLENDDDTYSFSKVTEFTRKWGRREIESLDQFR